MRTLDGSVAEHLNRLLVGAIVVDEHELIVSKRACHVRYPGSQLPRSVAFETLVGAREGPHNLLDLARPATRDAFFEVFNDPLTVQTGSARPAEIVATRADEWCSVVTL